MVACAAIMFLSYYTVDLEIFVQRNFRIINFRVKNVRKNDRLPH